MNTMSRTALIPSLRLPVIGSPMYIASSLELVLAQCKAGIVGTFPALNARPADQLDRWLDTIESELTAFREAHPDAPVGPHGVNLILHKSNDRLYDDLAVCVKRRVPVVITSVGNPREVVEAVHGYGGLVLHDVINVAHARKAAQAGVDGLILVCAGAGGHAGRQSPFALTASVREWFDGLVGIGGAISTGAQILGAQAMGADFAYMGTRFLVAQEANTSPAYRQAVIDAEATDLVYTDLFSGVHANFLRGSVVAAGYDPDRLPPREAGHGEDFRAESMARSKVWRDIWTAGQGSAAIHQVARTDEIVATLQGEYEAASQRLRQAQAASSMTAIQGA